LGPDATTGFAAGLTSREEAGPKGRRGGTPSPTRRARSVAPSGRERQRARWWVTRTRARPTHGTHIRTHARGTHTRHVHAQYAHTRSRLANAALPPTVYTALSALPTPLPLRPSLPSLTRSLTQAGGPSLSLSPSLSLPLSMQHHAAPCSTMQHSLSHRVRSCPRCRRRSRRGPGCRALTGRGRERTRCACCCPEAA
jgi:hypothetical protein